VEAAFALVFVYKLYDDTPIYLLFEMIKLES